MKLSVGRKFGLVSLVVALFVALDAAGVSISNDTRSAVVQIVVAVVGAEGVADVVTRLRERITPVTKKATDIVDSALDAFSTKV